MRTVQAALKRLGAVGPEQLQAVEVMWTPEDEGDVLTREEVNRDYPDLNLL